MKAQLRYYIIVTDTDTAAITSMIPTIFYPLVQMATEYLTVHNCKITSDVQYILASVVAKMNLRRY